MATVARNSPERGGRMIDALPDRCREMFRLRRIEGVPGDPPAEMNDEIIVTARKREERMIDLPIAITAMSGAGACASLLN